MLNAVLHTLLPHYCWTCNTISQKSICTICIESIKIDIKESNTPNISSLISLSPYETHLKKILHLIKFNPFFDSQAQLSPIIKIGLSRCIKQGIISTNTVLVPIPLHKKKEKQRGFNQVDQLFKKPLESFGLTFTHALHRKKATEALFDKSKKSREKTIKDAFKIKHLDPIKDQNIILFDDILSSGATLNEAAITLKKAGAKTINAITLSWA